MKWFFVILRVSSLTSGKRSQEMQCGRLKTSKITQKKKSKEEKEYPQMKEFR
jgi:hypothetical protein